MARKKKEESSVVVPVTKDAARKALIAKFNKESGERLIGSLKEEAINGYNVISTGVPSLDIKLGSGGIPRGRVTEIYGPNQAGKTTLALQMAANVYRAGGVVIYIDAECALDYNYAIALGLDVEDESRFLLIQPNYGEEAFNAIYKFIKMGLVDLIVVDSYPFMTPYSALASAEEKGFEKDPAVALSARMWGKFFDKVVKHLKREDIAFLVLNQERVVSQGLNSLGNGRAGGNVLKHVDFITIQMKSKPSNFKGEGKVEDGTFDGTSRETLAFIIKNKMNAPYRGSLLTIDFGKGVNYFMDLIDVCVAMEVGIKQSGAGWYTFVDSNGEELKKVQGKDKAAELLKEMPELIDAAINSVLNKTGVKLFNPQDPTSPYGRIDDKEKPVITSDTVSLLDVEDDDEELFTEEDLNATYEDVPVCTFIDEDLEGNTSTGL